MENIQHFFYLLLHIDTTLIAFVSHYGAFTYVLLFLIIFCETGLVITPFLPGDSLLFAAGSLAANASHALEIQLLFPILVLASILGNKVNYLIGRAIGPRVFSIDTPPRSLRAWLLNRKHLMEAHQFYEKHGGKTIILARFIPIIRTFAPFVAGVGAMPLRQFSLYNIVSGFLWIGSLLFAGYYFGSLPIVRDNFTWVIYGIIAVSLLPAVLGVIYRKTCSSRSC